MSFPDWKEVERALKMKSSSNFSYSCFQMFFPSVVCLQLTPNTASPTAAALQCSLLVSLLAHPLSLHRAPHLPIPNQGESSLLCPLILSLHSLSPPWQHPTMHFLPTRSGPLFPHLCHCHHLSLSVPRLSSPRQLCQHIGKNAFASFGRVDPTSS